LTSVNESVLQTMEYTMSKNNGRRRWE